MIQKVLWPLIVVMGLLSCTDEFAPEKGGGSNKALVKLEVRVPGGVVRTSRALQAQHEDEVSEIIVLAFEKGSDSNWNTRLRHVGKSVGTPQGTGTIKQFTVELQSGEWDLWVLTNAESIVYQLEDVLGVNIYSKDFLELGFNKSALQTALTQNLTGKWEVDPNNATGAYRIPMWGMLNAVQIAPSTTNIIKTVNLYRMLVKIDIEVQRTASIQHPDKYPGIPMEKFELTYASLHNYNRKGQLVPGVTAADGSWTNPGGGVALRTSLPSNPNGIYGWEADKRLEWSNPTDFTTPGTALNGVIYTVEADRGTDSNTRPCIIIGGKYDGSNEVTYYRADFTGMNKTPLDLLRNHRYRLVVRKIGGKGFSSVEDAYKAGPTQLETEVIRWNEGEYLEGVWNGANEIRFSSTKAHFTQFSASDRQEIKIKTNVPTLTLGDFTDLAVGQGDGVWQSIAENNWSNGHFNVKMEKVATTGEYSDYLLTVTAATAVSGDPDRQTTFIVKGYMLEVEITISQEKYMKYQLKTLPETINPISIDGEHQLVKIDVMSTHPYLIDFKGNPMFVNAYEDAAGTRRIPDLTNIPASVTTVYIEIASYLSFETRMGDFFIRHVTPESTAIARIYKVLQTSPIIMAELENGGHSGDIGKQGGTLLVTVHSNLAAWQPVLTINGVPYDADLSAYFSVINGVQSQYVEFTVPPMSDSETTARNYSITFKGVEVDVETDPAIIITQKAIGVNPPETGMKGPKDILCVDANGELNLDGRGYIVYFKWGSLIGIEGSTEQFNASQIAWAPAGYNVSAIGDDWDKIPYATSGQMPATAPSTGLGDPCTLASKDGVTGGWMMPTGATWFDPLNPNSSGWVTREIQGVSIKGRINQSGSMFYPAAGERVAGNGVSGINEQGHYWMNNDAISAPMASAMNFGSNFYNTLSQGRARSFPIRCVKK